VGAARQSQGIYYYADSLDDTAKTEARYRWELLSYTYHCTGCVASTARARHSAGAAQYGRAPRIALHCASPRTGHRGNRNFRLHSRIGHRILE